MHKIKYFFQALIIIIFLLIFKLIGLKNARILSSKIMSFLGPHFRSKNTIKQNLEIAFKDIDKIKRDEIIKNMWSTYGKILAEYVFIKKFRESKNSDLIDITGQKILDEIKESNRPVIFVSGHFDNFELMALHIEKSGIDLTTIYRPLNNVFLNPIMENIRKKFICKKQIKKGLLGTKQILKNFKNNSSIALMIDQRVSQGLRVDFFSQKALTSTIPAQFVKKFNCKIVPIYIERKQNNNFALKIFEPLIFSENDNNYDITLALNKKLEEMILKNPNQWIWSHNRWK